MENTYKLTLMIQLHISFSNFSWEITPIINNHNSNTGYLYSAVQGSITALTIYKQKEKQNTSTYFNIEKNTIEGTSIYNGL